MKENYQLKTDEITARVFGERPTLLLHSCCGPCSTYVLEYLREFFTITVLFYNPNIQPPAEYALRLENQKIVLARMGIAQMDCAYDGDDFAAAVRGLENEPEGGRRCTACFRLRMEKTARIAAENGFAYFCTTLSVSPHKDAARINAIGGELEAQYGVKWLPSDFKKRGGYLRSIRLSQELGLYRQDYCGCLFSRQNGAQEQEKDHQTQGAEY